MTYKTLRSATTAVCKNRLSSVCCFFCSPSSEAKLLLDLISNLARTTYEDNIKEAILLVELTALKECLEEDTSRNEKKFINSLNDLILNKSSFSLPTELREFINLAKEFGVRGPVTSSDERHDALLVGDMKTKDYYSFKDYKNSETLKIVTWPKELYRFCQLHTVMDSFGMPYPHDESVFQI